MGAQDVFLKCVGILVCFNLILVGLQAVGVPLAAPISYLDPASLIATFAIVVGLMLLISGADLTGQIGVPIKWAFSSMLMIAIIFSFTFIGANNPLVSFRDWLRSLVGITDTSGGFTIGIGLCTNVINAICGVNTLTGAGQNVLAAPGLNNVLFIPFIFFLTIGVIALIAGIMAMNSGGGD